MNSHPMKLVTIICESLAREPVMKLLSEAGAHGYTLFTVEGDGNRGHRTAEIQEYANIQVEVIVKPSIAENLLTRLETEFFPKFAMVAFKTDIRVLRREKF